MRASIHERASTHERSEWMRASLLMRAVVNSVPGPRGIAGCYCVPMCGWRGGGQKEGSPWARERAKLLAIMSEGEVENSEVPAKAYSEWYEPLGRGSSGSIH